ncbi:PP2C family protein-serine/threonine phosphatase [Streptomyces sp. NPDC001222]|uniref:PP2C family protein-serine/threonine phosphatase n=1 Tax=Streptomyces sp. NPDC001222 TaxID=3364548 RepID=UPI0036BF99C8
MIRIKAGPPRGPRPGVASGGRLGTAVARGVGHRVRRGPRRLGRAFSVGLPTVWGATVVTYKLACPLAQQQALGARIAGSAVFLGAGAGLLLHVRHLYLRELRQARKVAGAAQSVLLRPLPPWIDGLRVAAAQVSADRGATVGGDLYEVIATEHGVRIVMGDVRGHGLAALATAAAVLGSFREAVHDESELAPVLRRLDRALARHLREWARAEHPSSGREPQGPVAEEFVTLLLLEIGREGELRVLNCGHPWPYLLDRAGAVPLSSAEPLPPLGPFPLPEDLSAIDCGRLEPGQALFLHTDGAEDARDPQGRFFPLATALTEAVRDGVVPQRVLRSVFAGLLRHTGARLTDDVALLVVRNDRRGDAPSGARGTAGHATTDPHPTNHG